MGALCPDAPRQWCGPDEAPGFAGECHRSIDGDLEPTDRGRELHEEQTSFPRGTGRIRPVAPEGRGQSLRPPRFVHFELSSHKNLSRLQSPGRTAPDECHPSPAGQSGGRHAVARRGVSGLHAILNHFGEAGRRRPGDQPPRLDAAAFRCGHLVDRWQASTLPLVAGFDFLVTRIPARGRRSQKDLEATHPIRSPPRCLFRGRSGRSRGAEEDSQETTPRYRCTRCPRAHGPALGGARKSADSDRLPHGSRFRSGGARRRWQQRSAPVAASLAVEGVCCVAGRQSASGSAQ